jgi:hypothetical protein
MKSWWDEKVPGPYAMIAGGLMTYGAGQQWGFRSRALCCGGLVDDRSETGDER